MISTVGNLVHEVWHTAVIGLGLLLSVLATGHAVLSKRDSVAATAWVGFVWLVPLVGAAMYFIFGVNRIRHKAALLRRNLERHQSEYAQPECLPEELYRHLPDHGGHLKMLARVVGGVVGRPLMPENRIDLLVNGDEAYPAMLDAIQHARLTLSFVTYIFDRDEVGIAFAQAFGEAARREGEVRGVIDGPDENFEKLLWTLLGAIPIARYSIRIMTPYFLPDPDLISALNLASMRGVQVDIILPSQVNLLFVLLACVTALRDCLHRTCSQKLMWMNIYIEVISKYASY